VTAWDPLTYNPFRLLGVPREQEPPQSLSTAVVLAVPGLALLKLDEAMLQNCLAQLYSDQLPLHRATWFDSTRPLDQLCWLDICEGRLHEAWKRWSSEPHLLCFHNLAVLAHLRWVNDPENQTLWRDCARRWRELAELTQDSGYLQVLSLFRDWQRERAFELLGQGDALSLRECWSISAILSSPESVQTEQNDLLKADMERWDLDLSALRKELLEGGSVKSVTEKFEEKLLPQAQFLRTCSLDNPALSAQFRKDLGLFCRLLARTWWDVGEEAAKDYAEAWMEKALELAPPEEQAECRADLDHWRLSRSPVEVRPVAAPQLVSVAEAEAPRRRLGIVLALLALIGLIWAASRHRDPMASLTRPAAQKRADEIAHEITPLAQRLASLPGEIQRASGPERQRLEAEQEKTQKRHAALKGELVRLQRWLDRH